ncbi:MAG: glutaredoxin [Candidatus Azotimanducaceae bacterium]|jgi:glutaredoxin
MITVRLFTTLGCHLCDDALNLLNEYNVKGKPIHIEEIEIGNSDTLIDRYGIRIPVIQVSTDGPELGWPFDYPTLEHFLAEL